MSLTFFNTLSAQSEEFKPIDKKKVRLYTCGPTVYDYAHIGNFRAYVFEDLLRRWLIYRGFKVEQVMNITDVDDKTIANANKKKVDLNTYTAPYIQAFREDLETLRIQPAEHYPRATEYIPQMIQLIQKLEKNQHAYVQDGNVYYRVSTFKAYGSLSKKDLEMNQAGARVDSDEYQKEDAQDFALWKKSKDNEPAWESPYGKGRPGWHIECSAMSMSLLGEQFDIHTGGEDNIFPHHENEIAQSQGATGKKFVNYWLHCKFLLVEGEKMSKSKGNFYTLRDLIQKGHDPLAIRFLLLTHNYDHPLNFTFAGLHQAKSAVDRFNEFLSRLHQADGEKEANSELVKSLIQKASEEFEKALDENLNIAKAVAGIFELIRELNILLDQSKVGSKEKTDIVHFMKQVNDVLDIQRAEAQIPDEVKRLAQERENARKLKDFMKSDELRDKIAQLGFVVEDTKQGPVVKKR